LSAKLLQLLKIFYNCTHMTDFRFIGEREAVSLANGRTLFMDLSPLQQQELFGAVIAEHRAPDGSWLKNDKRRLDGEATAAFIGSTYGLVVSGVNRVRKPSHTRGDIYEHGDGINDYFANRSPGSILAHGLENCPESILKVTGEAWAESGRQRNRGGLPSVAYPSGLQAPKVYSRLAQLEDIRGDGLASNDCATAVLNSASDDFYRDRADDIGSYINSWRLAQPITPDVVTDELAFEQRLLIDADECDDEVSVGNEPSDARLPWNAADDYAQVEQHIVDGLRFAALPLPLLDETQHMVFLELAGIPDGKPKSQREVAGQLGITPQGVSYIQKRVEKILLTPEEVLAGTKDFNEFAARYGLYSHGLPTDQPNLTPEMIEALPATGSTLGEVARLAKQPDLAAEFANGLSYTTRALFDLYTGAHDGRLYTVGDASEVFPRDIKGAQYRLKLQATKAIWEDYSTGANSRRSD
jgi:hypothetical protein